MYLVLVLILVLLTHLMQKHNFVKFSVECKNYVRYLHDLIFKMENVQGDLLSHQIRFNKVKKEITCKKDKKSGWFS